MKRKVDERRRMPAGIPILALTGLAVFLLGDLYTSFGFLVCVLGGVLLLSAWLLALWWFSGFENEKIRKTAQAIKRITFTAVFAVLLSFLVIEGLIVAHQSGTESPDAPTLIVLGAGLHGDTPSAILTARLRTARDYLDAHPEAVAVLTGGQGAGESVTEASAMAAWLTRQGVDPARLYLEEQATDTVENLAFSAALIRREGLSDRTALLSQGFHLFRAERLAEQSGFREVQTVSAPVPQLWLIPSVYLREYCSVLLMLARSIF